MAKVNSFDTMHKRDTVDESIMKALKTKEKTQDALIEAVKAQIGG